MAGKVDWFGAGLPGEGKAADVTRIGGVADPEVPTCAMDERVGQVRSRLGTDDLCVVVNDERVVLGVVDGEDLDADDERAVGEVMQEAPKTVRPDVPASVLASQLEDGSSARALVTTSDGVLVGLLRAADLRPYAGVE